MKIIGCVMEINPPHNGHSYFLNQIKKDKDDILIVVTSTTIVQRGEFSVLNKKDKASWLLDHNVDLVIELPSIYANQGGYYFAKMAIKYLEKFNITDLYFGSESNDLDYLYQFIDEYNPNHDFKNGIYKSSLANLKSNDILGISYLQNISSNVNIHLVKRIKNNYNDNATNTSNIQSATYIRNHLDDPKLHDYLDTDIIGKIKTINLNTLFPTFLINLNYCLANNVNIFLSENNELLKKMNKIITTNNINNFEELIALSSDKNNTKSKIKRIIINTIFLIEQDKVNLDINYIHVLGLTNKASKYIKDNDIKVISSLKNNDDYIANKEILISNIYNQLTNQSINDDFTKPIIK